MNKTTRFILLLVLLAACFILGRGINIDPAQFKETLNQYPILPSAAAFVVLYVILTFFIWFGAKDAFRIVSAIVYGPYLSALLVYLGEMGNAVVLFWLSRKLGQDYVVQKLKIKEKDLEKTKENRGFLGSFTLRINPLIPYRFQDLGAGLSAVSFRKYMLAIVIASAPRILFFQYAIAGVGMSVFQDPQAAMNYMLEHKEILVFGQIYFLFVIVFTIYYFIQKSIQKRKAGQV